MCQRSLDSTPLWVKLLPVLPERLTQVSSAVCEYVNPGRLHHGQTGVSDTLTARFWWLFDGRRVS